MLRHCAATFTLGLLLLSPARSLACSCVATTFEQARDAADALFEGVVTHVEPDAKSGKRVSLRVVRLWKGDDGVESIEVRTGTNSAACGVPFEEGQGYLVFASDEGGGLFASLCSRTRRSEEASEDLAKLGAGITPVEMQQGAQPPAGESPKAPAEPETKSATVKKGGFKSCSANPGSSGSESLLLLAMLCAGLWMRRRPQRAR